MARSTSTRADIRAAQKHPQEQESTAMTAPVEDATSKSLVQAGEYDLSDFGEGFENVGANEYVTPYIILLQAKAKPTIKQRAEYVQGAEPGMFMDSVSHKLYDHVIFIPLHREMFEVEWIPRNDSGGGGGLVARHTPDEPVIMDAREKQPFGKIEGFGDGNEIVQTYYLYVMVLDEDSGMWHPAVITFSSTQIQAYKRLMSLARNQKVNVPNGQGGVSPQPLPLYAHAYKLTSKYKQEGSNDWFVMQIDFAADGDALKSRINNAHPQYGEAKAARKLVTSGKIRHADESVSNDDVGDAPVLGDEASAM